MKEVLPDLKINWTDPESHADQHVKRYEDQLVHASYNPPSCEVEYDSVETVKKRSTTGAVLETKEVIQKILSPKEMRLLRAHSIFSRRQGYIEAGGNPAVADEIIQAGNDMGDHFPRILRFKIR